MSYKQKSVISDENNYCSLVYTLFEKKFFFNKQNG